MIKVALWPTCGRVVSGGWPDTMEQMAECLGLEIGDVLGEGAEVFHIYTNTI